MSERFPADLASIRLFTAMDPLMNHQLRSLRECGFAMRAAMWLFFRMGAHMLGQMPLVVLIADLAMPRSLIAVVSVQMLSERIAPIKSFPADIADKIANFIVSLVVQSQISCAGECNVTNCALVRSTARVNTAVLDQLTTPSKALVA